MDSISVDFLDNVPVGIQFKFDSPKLGIGKNGKPYILHGCKVYKNKTWVDGSFFAIPILQTLIEYAGCKKDTACMIARKQVPGDKKKKYWEITKTDGTTITTNDIPPTFKATHIQKEEVVQSVPKKQSQYTLDDLFELYASIATRAGITEQKAGFMFIGAVIAGIHAGEPIPCFPDVNEPDDLPWQHEKKEDDIPDPTDNDLPF